MKSLLFNRSASFGMISRWSCVLLYDHADNAFWHFWLLQDSQFSKHGCLAAVFQTLFSPVFSYLCFALCWCSSTRREGRSYYRNSRSMKEWLVVSTAQYIKQTNKQNPHGVVKTKVLLLLERKLNRHRWDVNHIINAVLEKQLGYQDDVYGLKNLDILQVSVLTAFWLYSQKNVKGFVRRQWLQS